MSQQEMAAWVERALENQAMTIIAESGTGTGKTFAYLVPALLSEKRVIISTGTRHLQEQLFNRDLPEVKKRLAAPGKTALLKGRANYLCLHHLDDALVDRRPPPNAEQTNQLASINRWAETTQSGDVGEIKDVPDDASVWSWVTSTTETCLGSKCDFYEKCFVNKARKNAQTADIVVVNHHLFCSDIVLKEDGFGQLLPGYDAVIFDEAHQLPGIASSFLGKSVSTRQIEKLCADILEAEKLEQSAVALYEWLTCVSDGVHAIQSIKLNKAKGGFDELMRAPGLPQKIDVLRDALFTLTNQLENAAPAGERLKRCYERAMDLSGRVDELWSRGDDQNVKWYELNGRNLRLHATPVDVGKIWQSRVNAEPRSWIFTSATLAVGEDFSLFQNAMAINDAHTVCWPSPFDFKKQALLYLPQNLPDPRERLYTEHVMDVAINVLKITRGRAFLLFTSYRALNAAAAIAASFPYPILVQGTAPKSDLLDRFRQTSNAVLLGTHSFWEGVDVQGEALSCVLIDKLPFAPPDDPVLQARLKVLEQQGGNAFIDYQLPQAVITLKQGVGRLIRNESDSGLLVLCDPRITSKTYGRKFVSSLPAMNTTSDLKTVSAFFKA